MFHHRHRGLGPGTVSGPEGGRGSDEETRGQWRHSRAVGRLFKEKRIQLVTITDDRLWFVAIHFGVHLCSCTTNILWFCQDYSDVRRTVVGKVVRKVFFGDHIRPTHTESWLNTKIGFIPRDHLKWIFVIRWSNLDSTEGNIQHGDKIHDGPSFLSTADLLLGCNSRQLTTKFYTFLHTYNFVYFIPVSLLTKWEWYPVRESDHKTSTIESISKLYELLRNSNFILIGIKCLLVWLHVNVSQRTSFNV